MQCLLTILDAPINKSGHLRILIESTSGLVVEVNPLVRVPRTFKRFAGLMAQLLQTGVIYGSTQESKEPEVLLKILNGPIWSFLPQSTYCIALSQEGKTVKVSDYVDGVADLENICIVVGAKAQGADDFADEWVDDKISISNYSLSASVACAKFTDAVEEVWGKS
jgi:rRNA small subunit pseudouridine methyltransferase Nep1